MASNIGSDVFDGQFDLMVPGGGVGMFNGCSSMWGGGVHLGAQYGGFLATCQQQKGGVGGVTTPATYDAIRACVRRMCRSAFDRGRGQYAPLLASCEWFVNWYQAADNPNLRYRKVACPQALHERAGTGSFATAG